MDGRRFDELARVAVGSRRSFLGLLATGVALQPRGRSGYGEVAAGGPCRRPRDCPDGLTCETFTGTCVCRRPGRCGGCCSGLIICESGDTSARCGVDGQECDTCHADQVCRPRREGGGTCQCRPESCAAGCCTARDHGICQSGTAKDNCGKNGEICKICRGESVCDPTEKRCCLPAGAGKQCRNQGDCCPGVECRRKKCCKPDGAACNPDDPAACCSRKCNGGTCGDEVCPTGVARSVVPAGAPCHCSCLGACPCDYNCCDSVSGGTDTDGWCCPGQCRFDPPGEGCVRACCG